MSEHGLFKKFIALVAFDREVKKLEKERDALIGLIEKNIYKKQQVERALNSFDSQVHDAQKAVDLCELEMRSFEKTEQELKTHHDQVRHTDEYQAVKKEIEAIKKKQHDYEQILVNAWNKLEQVQKEAVSKKDELLKESALIQETITQEEHKKNEHAQKIEQILEERRVMERDVPDVWLQQYMSKRILSDDPIVPILSGCCSICFYHLSSQDHMQIKKNQLVQCRECYRLLYEPQEA